MTPVAMELRCQCRRGFKVMYDASIPTKLLSFDCVCGRTTPITTLPANLGDVPTDGQILDQLEDAFYKCDSGHVEQDLQLRRDLVNVLSRYNAVTRGHKP
jgi:hypothetical protein